MPTIRTIVLFVSGKWRKVPVARDDEAERDSTIIGGAGGFGDGRYASVGTFIDGDESKRSGAVKI